jgi:hypothetical protein
MWTVGRLSRDDSQLFIVHFLDAPASHLHQGRYSWDLIATAYACDTPCTTMGGKEVSNLVPYEDYLTAPLPVILR